MFFLRTFQLGLKSLLLHPMRSLLTVLGIFIGVASVIWLLAIAEGMSIEAQRQIEGLGADNIIVRSIKPPAEVTSGFSGPVPYGLKREEYKLLAETIPTLKSAPLPIREVRRTMSYDGREIDGRLVGCTPDYFEVTRLILDRGRLLTEADERNRKNYCVIASGVAEKLFPYQDPLGRRVYLSESKDYFQVVGILKYRTPTAAIGGSLAAQDFSGDVYIPIGTLRQQIGDFVITRRGSQMSSDIVELDQITLRIKDVKLVPQTAALIRRTLNIPEDPNAIGIEGKRNGPETTNTSFSDSPGDDLRPVRRDVALVAPYELLEQARVMRLLILVIMGMIAGVSLLVGGIGIMNIMLATVTERTREIGIRRALGATQRHIIMQFLVETVSLSVVGGVTGILLGLLGPLAFTFMRSFVFWLLPTLAELSPPAVHTLQPQIVWGSLPLSFGISVIVGVVFGIYPAIRAAKMDPIEALRHE